MWELFDWLYGLFGTRSADIIGNRSIHYTTRRWGRAVEGIDKIPLELVGRGPGFKRGHFKVRMRFPSIEAANAAARMQLQEDGTTLMWVDVPVIPREHTSENLPSEIKVSW